MKCPKCGEELETGMKFCTRCGVNVDDAIKELAERVQREEEEQRIAEENKKREEEQKQEELRREAERIEKEKQRLEEEKRKLEEDRLRAEREAEELKKIREENAEKERLAAQNAEKAIQASEDICTEKKEEELKKEIENDERKSIPQNKTQNENGFKPAREQKKVYKRKGFIRRFIDRLILIIILIIAIVVGVYYLNINGYLPEELSEEINGIIDQSKEIKSSMDGEYKKSDKSEDEIDENSNEKDNSKWKVENDIEAEDIFDLDDYVSGIIIDGKYGIIDNFTGRILLDTRYEDVKVISNKIIVKDNGKYYSLDSRYQIASEVPETTINTEEMEYIYNTNDNKVYVLTNKKILEEINKHDFHGHNSHWNDNGIVIKEASINEDDITESNSKKSIDYENIKFTGRCGLYHHTEGEFICECKYSKILNYSDGFSAAKNDSKAGFINEYGEELMFEYEETRSVHSGCAFVKQDGKWGILKIED